jgi:hypothetical protein
MKGSVGAYSVGMVRSESLRASGNCSESLLCASVCGSNAILMVDCSNGGRTAYSYSGRRQKNIES